MLNYRVENFENIYLEANRITFGIASTRMVVQIFYSMIARERLVFWCDLFWMFLELVSWIAANLAV
ncbi:hypothetical protein Glove_606g110 [Diversispora epigaea]|uniref:Uncharacterized protein n=1 Tax=Diversispora epigaea TaxID=1348612 RepID=A0A397GF94_9GLOM|nr:hypothetical protein Glove_606g110 [Diversispora epigaea]